MYSTVVISLLLILFFIFFIFKCFFFKSCKFLLIKKLTTSNTGLFKRGGLYLWFCAYVLIQRYSMLNTYKYKSKSKLNRFNRNNSKVVIPTTVMVIFIFRELYCVVVELYTERTLGTSTQQRRKFGSPFVTTNRGDENKTGRHSGYLLQTYKQKRPFDP